MGETAEAAVATTSSSPFRTVVVEGPLALRTRRLAAARQREVGLQILTLPLLAARLAGGFTRPAVSGDLEPVIGEALASLSLVELAPLAPLPGMRRALLHTLSRLWRADVDLAVLSRQHPRLAELHTLDLDVRRRLPAGVLTPPDLAAAALARLGLAPRLLGEVRLDLAGFVAPVWRPLLAALGLPVDPWPSRRPSASGASPEVFACASPDHEAIEALRWARTLVTRGGVHPADIAIAAVSPADWDQVLLGLASASDFPLHFTHGAPALSTPDGQACAALAELLIRGLSIDRVRRWLAYAGGRAPALTTLPVAPLLGVPRGASLVTLDNWRRALSAAVMDREDGADPGPTLLPALEMLSQGVSAAEGAGATLLPSGAAKLWARALRAAPAGALPFVLETLRTPDGRDPGACVTWGPAEHLAAAPRAHVWLLGLNAGGWPRPSLDDPLLPDHILALPPERCPPRAEADRRAFAEITDRASTTLRLSFGSRARGGAVRVPSPLLPRETPPVRLSRTHRPRHALSDGDRLQARPAEAAEHPLLRPARACHLAQQAEAVTAYDGLMRREHPLVLQALSGVQSARSLTRLLRDPHRFVWEYALGWSAPAFGDQPLGLDDRAFGDLIHLLLQSAIDRLEPDPGFTRANADEVTEALAAAVAETERTWPLRRPTPPQLLWRHTLDGAAELALRALQFDQTFQPGTRSWTEVPFGETEAASALRAPWPVVETAPLPGTPVRLQGRIDRLELTADDRAARLTDYKTGAVPPRADGVLRGGAEMQRVTYAAAVRHHRPDARIVARLIYLAEDAPREFRLAGDELEAALSAAARIVNAGVASLRNGVALPGPDTYDAYNPVRIALPAGRDAYRQRKARAFARAFGDFSRVWNER